MLLKVNSHWMQGGITLLIYRWADTKCRGDFKGAQGAEPSLLKVLIILGAKNSCIGLTFQSLLVLLPKYFLLLWSIFDCYVVIETFLIVN